MHSSIDMNDGVDHSHSHGHGHDAASVDEATHLLGGSHLQTSTASNSSVSNGNGNTYDTKQQNARSILLSATLTRLGSRSWEFATPLLLLEWSPGSLAAPASLGLTCALFRTVVSPWLGSKADGWDRFAAVAVGTGMQAAGCCMSVGALMVWNALSGGADWTARATLALVIAAGVIETLGAQLASVAVKKEWVPIVFDEDKNTSGNLSRGSDANNMMAPAAEKQSCGFFACIDLPPITLSFINTTMTNIDLLAAMFGPILAGWILQVLGGEDGSMQRGFVAIAIINAVSFAPEVYLLRRVYRNCPGLQRQRGPEDLENTPTNDNNETEHDADDEQKQQRNGQEKPNKQQQSDNPWKIWFHHPSGLPLLTLSLAALYLTALSPSGVVLTAYLITIGLSPTSIGIFRAIGAFSGVLGIGLFSLFRRWGDNDDDAVELGMEVGAAERAASVRSIERLRRISLAFLLLEVVSIIVAAVAHFLCESANLGSFANSLGDSSAIPWQIVLFMGAIVVSRAGLYSFDVGALEIEQYVVDERYRNAVGSVEVSLCSVAEIGMYVLSIIFSDPSQFGVQVNVSAAAVSCGGICFGCFLCLYHMHRHHHLECEDHRIDHDHDHHHRHAHTYQQERDLKEYGYHIHLHKHQSDNSRLHLEGVPSLADIYNFFGGHAQSRRI